MGPCGDTARNDSQLSAVAAKATAPYKDVPASETTLIALKVNLLIQAAEEKKTAFAKQIEYNNDPFNGVDIPANSKWIDET
ncbi:hypothetical protein CEXT_47231 [Caerostris extrusa]|uniref:Uncharacterized protein n=1 Tax=Caerostris extrusa TaxID=172846 RepID=A0AAV4MUF6_CAEEX|nr:hypothetical protein CEXT_47231 [Caerostris extrusa]